MKQHSVNGLVRTALGMAVVYVCTLCVKVPNGLGGYLNLGDGCIFLFAGMLLPWQAFFVGGVASMLADLTGGFVAYALPTLLIKGLEGIVACVLLKRTSPLCACVGAGLVMVGGYFVFEWMFYQSLELALGAAVLNLLQASAGIGLALVCGPVLKRMNRKTAP